MTATDQIDCPISDSPKKDEMWSIVSCVSPDIYKAMFWEGSFEDYSKIVKFDPRVARSAFQRIYDMILADGVRRYTDAKKPVVHYNFFDSLHAQKTGDAIFGLDIYLQKLVGFFKSAGRRWGTHKRVLLLHGPVGSSKSTIVRLLKRGLEQYSKTDQGKLYSFSWIAGNESVKKVIGKDRFDCPMNEEPFKLIPDELISHFDEEGQNAKVNPRESILELINRGVKEEERIHVEGSLCPACRFILRHLLVYYNGDFERIIRDHILVRRVILSEKDRVGIGTFQPKDEKNQDSTELTGDINYRQIGVYGTESDPRAFNFDGEFNIANRGIIEFIEVLKLEVAFLYDLLGASQEHEIKPKKFAQTHIDEVIIGHTNEPEFRKLQDNEFMEALRDRTVKIDIPYITKLDDEIKVYTKDFNQEKIKAKHIAPHTIEMAATWAVLTRLEDPKKAQLSLLQKLKLYNGKSLPGFTEDSVKELHQEAPREGMEGISPRFIQDQISNALIMDVEEDKEKKGESFGVEEKCINPFMVFTLLEGGLKHHGLITSEEQRNRCRELIGVTKEEYASIVKTEVKKAATADEEAIKKLCTNYIDNIKAYTQKEKIRNKYTGEDEEPNERLMKSIEEKIDIPESRKDDFRREIMNYIGALAIEGKTFHYKANERLHEALEEKLFEDNRDQIKFISTMVSSVVDKKDQEKIDVIKARLIRDFGYCDVCATNVLSYVASIFARGDIGNKS